MATFKQFLNKNKNYCLRREGLPILVPPLVILNWMHFCIRQYWQFLGVLKVMSQLPLFLHLSLSGQLLQILLKNDLQPSHAKIPL